MSFLFLHYILDFWKPTTTGGLYRKVVFRTLSDIYDQPLTNFAKKLLQHYQARFDCLSQVNEMSLTFNKVHYYIHCY